MPVDCRTGGALAATAAVWLTAVAWPSGQARPGPPARVSPRVEAAPGSAPAPLAEDVFKNVRVLRGIPVDEFMATMGVFSAALGLSCEDCHAASDASWANYALDVSPKKLTARRMVLMTASINQASFGGRQVVTCYTCHRGSERPKVTPSLARLYGEAVADEPDEVVQPARNAPPAVQMLDRYLQAIGGADHLSRITSFVAHGTSVGYGPEGTPRRIEIFAEAPDRRTVIIHTLDGDSTTVFDGRHGWIAAPHRPLPLLPLTGGELQGVGLDARLSFPAQIKEALGDWRVGTPTEIEGREVQVVQGSAAGVLATLYFDAGSGLLTRLVRYADSKVGRVPTQFDYADYRDVGGGVKMPFRWQMTWLDGFEKVELAEIRTNVPIDASRFAQPAPAH